MKKVLLIAIASVVMMSATSCQSVEKKAEKFKARMEKAVTDGDLAEAAKVGEEDGEVGRVAERGGPRDRR